MATAEREAEASKREALVEAKAEALRLRTESEADLKSRAVDLDKKEDRFAQREATLDSRAGSLDRKEQAIESKEADLVHTREQLEEQGQRVRGELERVAQMTAADARQSLINQVEDDAKRDAMVIVRDVEAQAVKRRTSGPARSSPSRCSCCVRAHHRSDGHDRHPSRTRT